jgi:GNAT superfamily N-acetyltransferase
MAGNSPDMRESAMAELTIRRAASTDADETAAVLTASLKSMTFFPKLHTDQEDWEFVRGFVQHAETWIAERNGRIIGLACLDGGKLVHLYVDPAFHGQRTGTALLNRIKLQRPNGFEFWVFQANAAARRFYERHGCTPVEFTDGSGNEEKLPDVRYQWRGL